MKFAIIQDNVIKKVIVSEDMEQAMTSCLSLEDLKDTQFDIVEVIETENDVYEESVLVSGNIIPPRPYESWVFLNNQWTPPKNVPEDNTRVWMWDENIIDWKDMGPAEYLE